MGERPLPPLAHLRTVLRIDMSSDEFFLACDDLMEQFALRISSPTLDQRLVGIHVAEGDVALCFCVCRSGSAAPCRPGSAALGFRLTDGGGSPQRPPPFTLFRHLQLLVFTRASFLGLAAPARLP